MPPSAQALPKPRYVAQKRLLDCGPVAVLNAAKWSGQKLTLRDLPNIRTALLTDSERGTPSNRVGGAIRRYCAPYVKVKSVPGLTLSALDRHLASGGAAIVLAAQVASHTAEDNHYFLVRSIAGRLFRTVNFAGERESLVSWQIMRDYLRPRRGSSRSVPQGWLLS